MTPNTEEVRRSIDVEEIRMVRVEGEWITGTDARLVTHLDIWDSRSNIGTTFGAALVLQESPVSKRIAIPLSKIQAIQFVEENKR